MKSIDMLNKILIFCLLVSLSSCGILRQKEKTKVVVKIDSIHQESTLENKIDTGSVKSYKKTTYYLNPVDFSFGGYPRSLINATTDLANSASGLKNSANNVLNKADFGQVLATVEEWLNEKKGISETKSITPLFTLR